MDDGQRAFQRAVGIYPGASTYSVVETKSLEIKVELVNLTNSGDFFKLVVQNIAPAWVSLLPSQFVFLDRGQTGQVTLKITPPADAAGSYDLKLTASKQNETTLAGEASILLTVTGLEAEAKPRLNLGQNSLSLQPGSQAIFQATLYNGGQSADTFILTAHGLGEGWVTLDPSSLYLAVGEEKQFQVSLKIPASVGGQAEAYRLDIQAQGQKFGEQSAEASLLLTVAAYQASHRIGVHLNEVNFEVSPGDECTIPVRVTNLGLSGDMFNLSLESKAFPAGWVWLEAASGELSTGQQQTLQVKIRPPKKYSSFARQYPFTLKVQSRYSPEQVVRVDCRLTVTAFHQYSIQVAPRQVYADQPIRVSAENRGNLVETFSITWAGKDQAQLSFNVLSAPPVLEEPSNAPTQVVAVTRVHQAPGASGSTLLRVDAGKTASLQFNVKPKTSPLLGKEKQYSFETRVTGSDQKDEVVPCAVTARPLIPVWIVAVFILVCVVSFCAVAWLVNRSGNQDDGQTAAVETQVAYSLTQTVSAVQTSEAEEVDSDSDGLLDSEELRIGTNPSVPDTDMDKLLDGEEVKRYDTNPVIADSDQDGLVDGDEIAREINPNSPDTDADGLKDGDEVRIGSNPKAVDTDLDGLTDKQEADSCTSPTSPDTDSDGVADDEDLEPCDKLNPALTNTAVASIPTATQTPSPTPTQTVVPQTPTPSVTATPPLPSLPGSLLFSSSREGRPQLYVRDMNTGGITRLTNSQGDDTLPAWSPDGSRVVFTSNRDGNQEIYVMDINGSNLVDLTNHPSSDSHPTWSPDGEWIAFSTNRDGNDEIYVMRTDGSELQNLTNHPASDMQPYWEMTPGINAAGGTILFVTDRDGNQEVYQMDATGQGLTNLTRHGARDYQPVFSPDGKRMAFVSERNGNPDVFVMDSDGTDLINLTASLTSVDEAPSWSEDNHWVACSTNLVGNFEIYLLKADGSLRYNITSIQGDDRDPAWR